MLKRFRADNFKNLINVTFDPGDVNLVIGRNNSGKTTLCQALHFVGNTSVLSLADAAVLATGEPWNLPNAYLDNETVTFEVSCEVAEQGEVLYFEYRLSIRAAVAPYLGPFTREFSVEREELTVVGGRFKILTVLIDNHRGQSRVLDERRPSDIAPGQMEDISAPSSGTMLSRVFDDKSNRTATLFKAYLAGWQYYDMDLARLRSGEARTQGYILNSDGSNLVNALYLLKTTEDRLYRRLVDLAREVEPRLDGINFAPPAQNTVYMSMTDSQDKRFGIASLSGGTLRFLAIAYIVLTASYMAQAGRSLGPVIIIEEPENGLFVGHLKQLLSLVEPQGPNAPQFIFTTHSPYFVDLFDRYPGNVFVAKADETHSDIVHVPREHIERVLQKYPLGEAHFQGLLA